MDSEIVRWAEDWKVVSSNPAWNTTTSVPLSKAISPQLRQGECPCNW